MIDIEFLAKHLGLCNVQALPRDVSPREYFRVNKGDQIKVLMVYHDVNAATKEEMRSFVKLSEWLVSNGLKAPQIFSYSEEYGYLLLEDLGSTSFGAAIRIFNDQDHKFELYSLAGDVLHSFLNIPPPSFLPLFENSRIYANRRQLIDYYFPLERGKLSSEELVNEYYSIWDRIVASVPPCPRGFVHGDFHLENLMLCENENGIKRCGIIDFQDALNGFLPYDIVNLLEDARVDVPTEIKEAVLLRYCAEMSAEDKGVFLNWYRILGTQFHGRVLGLFIKLAAEQRRDKYLVHINRLQKYMIEGLKDPILLPLRHWFDKQGVDFSPIKDLNGDAIRTVFSEITC